ncbi:MAG: hypothetical protein V4597_17980 [Pseudomonadota bacterium]
MPSILEPEKRRPRRTKTSGRVDPLVGEIAEALLRFGGSAHRDRVIEYLALNRSPEGGVQLSLRARAVAAFDAHSGSDRDSHGVRPLFRKPFGPGSHRWALTAEAEAFLRAGGAARDVESAASL